jgi:hypothetical protein
MSPRLFFTAAIVTAGLLLAIAGLALLIDPALLAVAVGGLVMAGFVALRRRRPGAVRIESLVVAAALATTASCLLEGINQGTMLLALGFVVLLIGSWDFDRTDGGYSAASSHQ